MAAAAIIGALVAPIRLTLGGSAPATPAVAAGPASQADPAALSIAAQLHIPVAQAESRLSWQQDVPSLSATLTSALPAAAFGGIWIATNDGDRVKISGVGLTPGLKAVVMRAVRDAGLSAAADLVPDRYSLAQLVSADTWLAGQLDKLTGAIHLDAGYRTDLNRVQLGVAGTMTSAERALVARAKARYGDLVQVVAQAAGTAVGTSLDCVPYPGKYCFPPLRGAITIYRVDSHGHRLPGQCTGAFIARSRVDGKLYMFTAGHCAAEAGTGLWATKFPGGSQHVIGRCTTTYTAPPVTKRS